MSAGAVERLATLWHAEDDWSGLKVVVLGLGVSGFSAADALLDRGAVVVVVDASSTPVQAERGIILDTLGATVLLGPEHAASVPQVAGSDPDLIVTSPGWAPSAPILVQAAAQGIPVWGDVELAWRMRARTGAAPWLTLTGTNGKTTTVRMLESMLRADGRRAIAAGNVGTPLLEAVLHPDPYQVIAVELSSFQLHWSFSLRPLAAAVLNVAEDHIDWHGSRAAYARDKGKVFQNAQVACVYNVADPVTEQLVRDADVVEGCRAIGFTLGVPSVSNLGVVEDVLCDRAFVEQRATSAAELADLNDVRCAVGPKIGPHHVANALAAAALARAAGVTQRAVRDGLRGLTPEPHRISVVAEQDQVTWVDDSKATNPHAAAAALSAFDSVVWVAGGLAKGATFEDLIQTHGWRMRAAILIGADAPLIREALARHGGDIPVIEVQVAQTEGVDTSSAVMQAVVTRAADVARPGDTVLLAPACASMDQFRDYADRGNRFAEAVRSHLAGGGAGHERLG